MHCSTFIVLFSGVKQTMLIIHLTPGMLTTQVWYYSDITPNLHSWGQWTALSWTLQTNLLFLLENTKLSVVPLPSCWWKISTRKLCKLCCSTGTYCLSSPCVVKLFWLWFISVNLDRSTSGSYFSTHTRYIFKVLSELRPVETVYSSLATWEYLASLLPVVCTCTGRGAGVPTSDLEQTLHCFIKRYKQLFQIKYFLKILCYAVFFKNCVFGRRLPSCLWQLFFFINVFFSF